MKRLGSFDRATCADGGAIPTARPLVGVDAAVESGMAPFRSETPGAPDKQNEKVCVGCAALAPPADGETTLISLSHGWRVVRAVGGNGRSIVEWRCPACWSEYRAKGPASRRRPR